ncbi:MAG TPA: DUF748 domain-containing protein [Methylomirabilota bacterium]
MIRRRILVIAGVMLGVGLLSAAALWVALPGLARWALVRQIEAQTGRRLTVQDFVLDLGSGHLRLTGVHLADREPGPPLAEFDRLEIRFHPTSLLRGHIWIEEIALDNPRVRVVRLEDGRLNVADLLRPTAPRERPLAVTVDRLALTGGAVLFEDRTLRPARTWRAEALTVEAEALSTVNPEPRGRARLTTTVAGAPLAVEVTDVALAPVRGRARLTLRDLDATLANLYLPAETAVLLERAALGATLTAGTDGAGGLRLEGQARLDNLLLRRRGVDASLVTVPSLLFALTTVTDPDGRPRGRVEVTGQATVHDPRPGYTNRFDLERIRLVVEGLDLAGREPARVSLTAALPGGGGLDVEGSAGGSPVASALRARVSRVDLAFWAPYLELPLLFTGVAETELTIDVAAAPAPAPDGLTTRIRGRALLKDASVYGPPAPEGAERTATRRSDGRRRLLAADAIELTGLDAQWPKARVERVRLARPRVTVERDREGRLPIRDVLESLRPAASGAAPGAAAGAKATPRPGAPAVAIEIGEIAVEDGRVRLDDVSVSPAARLPVAPISLTARDVTWPGRRPARVKLAATTPEAGTVEAEGTVSLDPVRFELRAKVAGVALAPYRAYVPVPARLQGRLEADLALNGRLGEAIELRARGSAALADLVMADGDRPVITVGRIDATGIDYAWPATATIDRVHMKKSWVHVERRADGTVPIGPLLTLRRSPAGAAPAGPASASAPAETVKVNVTVRESLFEDGSATIVDAGVTPAARIELAGARLAARGFVWPARDPVAVSVEMPAPGGGRVTANGHLDVAARALEMQVKPTDVDVSPLQPYLPVRGRIAGKASGDLRVTATLDPFTIAARGTAALADLALADRDRPVATAARLEASGIDYAFPATVAIEAVRLRKPWAQIDRAADGSFPVTALFAPPRAAGAASGGAASGGTASGGTAPGKAPPTVDVRVQRTDVEDGAIAIVDGAVRPPARAELRGVKLEVVNATWPARGASQVKLRTETGTGGHVEAQGQVRVDTRAVDLRVDAKQLDLATLQAFLPSRGTLEGKLDADLRVRGTLEPLAATATGRLALDDPTFGDGDRMLGYIKRVDVTGLDADWPRRVTVERVTVDRPWALVEREADGSVPLLGLLMGGRAPGRVTHEAVARDPQSPAAAPPAVTIGSLAVEEGFVRFVDRTTRPAFAEEASRIALTGRGLGTARGSRGQVALNGRLTGGAPFEIKGALGGVGGPLDADLEGKLTDFPLTRVNPYSNQLIGWIARRGAFGATVHYRVNDNQMEGTNEILIGQPEYVPSRSGDAVRERVGVPFGLLTSLLKNAKGEIRLSVPVSGDLGSGQLDLSEAFWAAIRETAISVMALPVSWVGKIFYTEDSRIDTVQIWPVYFEPGTTQFARDFDRHADRLAGFLRDAPGVTLAMKAVHTVEDITALKRAAVRGRIETAARERGQTPAAVAARLFAESFPGQTAPSGLDAVVAELARIEPNPDEAARALATRRMEITRARLGAAKGSENADRLRSTETVVPVEASGQGRIEFEIQ